MDSCSAAFVRFFRSSPRYIASAPGRVNLIGEHTDYNEGFVLPAAIDRHVHLAAGESSTPGLSLYAVDLDEHVQVSDLEAPARGKFSDYLQGMARCLAVPEWLTRSGVAGLEIAVRGDVPRGGGLSSSAALLVAAGSLFTTILEASTDPRTLARLAQRVENEFVGLQCGIMDPYCSAHARKGQALLLDCRSLEHRVVPFPADRARIVILDTRVERKLAESAYNDRRRQCQTAAERILEKRPASLRDVTLAALESARDELPDLEYRRARHVITENERTHSTVAALEAGRLDEMGRLLDRSHESLRDDYEVSCAELDFAVDTARSLEGVYGARMTGAGFGGCAMALVAPEAVASVVETLDQEYVDRFGRAGSFFPVEIRGECTSGRT